MPVGRVEAFSSFTIPQTKAESSGTKQLVENSMPQIKDRPLDKFTKKQAVIGAVAAAGVLAAIAGGILIHKKVNTKNVLREVQELGQQVTAATKEAGDFEAHSNRVFNEVCENFKNGAEGSFGEIKSGDKIVARFELNKESKLPEKLIEYAPDDKGTVIRTTLFKYEAGTGEIESYTIDEFAKEIQGRHVYDSTGRLEYFAQNFKSNKGGAFSADTVYQPQMGDSILYRDFRGDIDGKYSASKKFIMHINGDCTVHKGVVNSSSKETFELVLDENGKARLERYILDSATDKERVYILEDDKLKKLEPDETEMGYEYDFFDNDDFAD